jgi:hypothetical protein
MSTNLRTIWLTLRATNYTTAVFTNVISNLSGFTAAQQKAINSSLNLGKSAFAAGMLFNVLGSQMGGAAGQALTYASYVMYLVAGLSYLKAGILAANAFLSNHAAIVNILSSSYFRLGIAMMAGFAIFFLLKDYLGTIPALLLAIAAAAAIMVVPMMLAAGALSGLTFGGSATAGAAGMVALTAASSVGMLQHGTRRAEFTGPAILHRGEVVYNPSTGRPTQIGNDLQGVMGGGITTIDASIHADTINTKADTEELNNILKKQGRKIAVDRM